MNYYEILGVDQDATEDEIKSAFRKLAVDKHPDKGGSAEEFIEIKTAYDTLKNPLLRKDYDLKLRPESIDNTYNSTYDFSENDAPGKEEALTKYIHKIDEEDIIRQLAKIAWEIRGKSILNTVGGLLIGLSGLVLTICTIGFVVFSGLINSGFGMTKRNFWQIVNPYTNLFGVLERSKIHPTTKIEMWIKRKRRNTILRFVVITLMIILIIAIILSTY